MKKNFLFGCLALVMSAVTVLAAVEANAFCIYNYTSFPMQFEQVGPDGGFMRAGMNKVIPSKGKECCNWENKECNPGGKKTSTVYFSHNVYNPANSDVYNYRCNEYWKPMEMQAGGWAEIYNNPSSRWGISCVVYRAN